MKDRDRASRSNSYKTIFACSRASSYQSRADWEPRIIHHKYLVTHIMWMKLLVSINTCLNQIQDST